VVVANVLAFADETENNEQPAKRTTISSFEVFIMSLFWE